MALFINGETDYNEWRDHAKDNKKYKERMALISELLPKKNNLNVLDQYRLANAIAVSALTGKLEDFWSISTSVLMNPICQCRAKCEECICKDCYAAAGVSKFSGLTQALETNYLILNNFLLDEEVLSTIAIPSTNGKSRIESHGDAATEPCAINYKRIVASHKYLDFGLWSKNLGFYKATFEAEGKPNNMVFIASSPFVNKVMKIPEDCKWFVDKVFTVYELEYANEHGIEINCGTWNTGSLDHRCKLCMRCYDLNNTDYYINELKK
jgi:hypothetical protein